MIAAAMRLAVVRSGLRSASRSVLQVAELEVDLALDERAVGDAPDRGHAARDLRRLALGREAGDRHRALRHGVDLAIRAEQRRDEQRAALQALGIAQRRDGDVDARALRAEGREVGGDHHGRDVGGAQVGVAGVDAEPLQHRLQALLGEGRVVQRVARAVEADHEAVADELVLAHAFD